MFSLAEKIRMGGVFVFLVGSLCLPFPRTSPKSALSLFNVLAEMGLLTKFGFATMLLGAVLFLTSFFIKK